MSSDTLASTNTVALTATLPFSFQPPPGGDINLKSCDGTMFRTHSVMLGLASTVFDGMFGGAETRADTIDLAEDAEAISLMLAFIYPTTLPPITNVNTLEKAMLVAHKYDIRRITELVEGLFQSDSLLITLDPIRVFGASAKYGFTSIQKMAAKFLCSNGSDILSVEGLARLAKSFPEASHTIGLVGALSLRVKTLDEILFIGPLPHRLYPTHLPEHSDDHFYGSYMTCPSCWKSRRRLVVAGVHFYIPGWYYTWALQLRIALQQKPISNCEHYFNISWIWEPKDMGVEGCSSCVSYTASKGPEFNAWGKSARQMIQDALEPLDAVFSL